MVERYPAMSDEAEDSQVIGEFVRYSDYAKLEEALRECVEKIEKDCIDYCYGGPDHSKKCAEEECEWAEIIKKAREVLDATAGLAYEYLRDAVLGEKAQEE